LPGELSGMRAHEGMRGDVMRILVQFEKTGPARYISHLDLLRCVQRTLKLMDAPMVYTAGFNPHPKLSFAQALPMYMESVGEYFVLELTRPVDFTSFVEDFNRRGYTGIKAVAAREMPREEGNPMAMVRAARYAYPMAGDPGEIRQAVAGILGEKEVLFDKKGKGGVRQVNLRERIFELGYQDGVLHMLLGCGEKNLVPAEVVNRLYERMGEKTRVENKDILRTQLYYFDDKKGIVPFL
jgi:radical SAM-linked protein